MSKWVTTWSNAPSIVDPKPEGYAKDITLRYPILSAFDGDKIRITLDNFTGKEMVHIEKVTIAKTINEKDIDASTLKTITFNSSESVDIEAGGNIQSDEIEFAPKKNEKFTISIYLNQFTSMRSSVTTIGPLTKAFYALGDQSEAAILPMDDHKEMAWFYFLTDVDVYTDDTNEAILCFGDSITAQAWPEYLQLRLLEENKSVSSPRKAVSGARVLRQYNCAMYEQYGIKGNVRFDHETNIAGCDKIIVLQGINDFIHPVGIEVNPFRPMSDLPTAEELIEGYRYYIKVAKEKGCKIYFGTLLPIKGWRTYEPFRNDLRETVNEWIRTTDEIDGFIDFDKDMRKPDDILCLNTPFDSGDHLHPSMDGYAQMADTVMEALKQYEII